MASWSNKIGAEKGRKGLEETGGRDGMKLSTNPHTREILIEISIDGETVGVALDLERAKSFAGGVLRLIGDLEG